MKRILSLAKPSQNNDIISLLTKNKLPVKDIDFEAVRFYVYEIDHEIIATGAVEKFGNDLLMRSIAVKEEYKSQGIGKQIVEEILAIYRKHTIYLLTENAAGFFENLGFKIINRDSVPSVMKETSQFLFVCPASATCMKRNN